MQTLPPHTNPEVLLPKIKAAVLSVDPEAQVILFGSRARGDAKENSDWDVLVITEKPIETGFKYALSDAVYKVALEYVEAINTLVRPMKTWREEPTSSFLKNVRKEGIQL